MIVSEQRGGRGSPRSCIPAVRALLLEFDNISSGVEGYGVIRVPETDVRYRAS